MFGSLGHCYDGWFLLRWTLTSLSRDKPIRPALSGSSRLRFQTLPHPACSPRLAGPPPTELPPTQHTVNPGRNRDLGTHFERAKSATERSPGRTDLPSITVALTRSRRAWVGIGPTTTTIRTRRITILPALARPARHPRPYDGGPTDQALPQ